MAHPVVHFEIIGKDPQRLEAAVRQQGGGKRVMGPARSPSGLVVGHFTDPEGTLIGVAGAA